jgi:hypothetical protein
MTPATLWTVKRQVASVMFRINNFGMNVKVGKFNPQEANSSFGTTQLA